MSTIYQVKQGSMLRGLSRSAAMARCFATDIGSSIVRATDCDDALAHELLLYGVNDFPCYEHAQRIMVNLIRKMAKLQYCEIRANVAWKYLASRIARDYAAEFGCAIADYGTRCGLAIMLAGHYEDEMQEIRS